MVGTAEVRITGISSVAGGQAERVERLIRGGIKGRRPSSGSASSSVAPSPPPGCTHV